MTHSPNRLLHLLGEVKRLAKEYYDLTGRPLGVTGEVAEYEAIRLLGLKLAPVRQPGYDAVGQRDGRTVRYQIKGRCMLPGCSPSQRLGRIRLEHDWDAVLLVLLDATYNAIAIYEAPREKVTEALTKPGSKARNERGALGVRQFRRISELVWEPA